MVGVSRRLSLTVAGSSTNASLGAVSGVVVEVTHSGAAPAALVATQPAGKAGAVTPSKFSVNVVVVTQRAQREGVNDIAEIGGAILEVNGCGERTAAGASGREGERPANRSSRRHQRHSFAARSRLSLRRYSATCRLDY